MLMGSIGEVKIMLSFNMAGGDAKELCLSKISWVSLNISAHLEF